MQGDLSSAMRVGRCRSWRSRVNTDRSTPWTSRRSGDDRSGVGSTALNVRFLPHHGLDATTAITSDVAMSVVSGVAEVLLVGICVALVGRRLDVGELPEGTVESSCWRSWPSGSSSPS